MAKRTPKAAQVGLDDTELAESDPRPARRSERSAVVSKNISGTRTDEPSVDKRATSMAMPPRPGAMLGQYQLIRELGRGGMGAVYLARDTRLGRRVAIKFLTHDDPAQTERFLAEAQVTARCRHDNIVIIHDICAAPKCSYMVLEYLEGVTLRAWLRDRWQSSAPDDDNARAELKPAATSPAVHRTPVSATLAVELMVPVVRALAHAHDRGLVHRDLKPENIMLADDGSIKVLDFGIAKVLDPLLESRMNGQARGAEPDAGPLWPERAFKTREGALIGTMPYMSPEQWRGQAVDARADVWAVGIVLWELCTGRHPLAPLSPQRIQSIGLVDMPMPSLTDIRPQLGPLASIVDRCLRKRAAERIQSAQGLLDELELLLPGRGRAGNTNTGEPDNPYVGLAAFQQSDANRFYGRDRDVARMMTQLRNHRLVTVAGASGAGKSSFVRAGVIPALQRSGHGWESFIIRPGRRPLTALASVLTQVLRAVSQSPDGVPEVAAQDSLLDTLRSQPGYLGTVMRTRCQRRNTRMLLFVDQLEELYTLGTDRDTREAFVACLEGVADDASSPLRVILTVRSDFMDRVAEDRTFTSEITRAMTLLSPLSRVQLRQALTEPLDAAGYTFESEALVDTMLDTLQATRSPLPLLQFTAARLWHARDPQSKRIGQDSYDALGGIEGALASHADAVLARLASNEQRLARTVFTCLVSEDRTRAIVSLNDLCANAAAGTSDAVARIVRHLAEARLVLMASDSDAGATVELTHESLIDRWPKLVHWLDEDQEAAHFRSRVRAAARQWDTQGRTEDFLWRGQAADEARRWHSRNDIALADLGAREQAYLQAVIALAARARRNRRRALAALIAFLGAVAVVVSLLAVRAERQAVEAEDQARRADENAARMRVSKIAAQESAAAARNASRMAGASEHKGDPTLVLALVREMEPAGSLPEKWREVAHWAIHKSIAAIVFNHQSRVYSAVFSPDGTRIVTASSDKTARVWNADGTGTPMLLTGHQDGVISATFSPDGTRIVTTSWDKTARVWNADGTGTPVLLKVDQYRVSSASFSPDGTRIVFASNDKTVRVLNADGTGTPMFLTGHQSSVSSASFSPNGTRIVTASSDGSVQVRNADGTGTPLVLTGHQGGVSSAAFSPDGTRIVTASSDETARVWNADGTGTPVVLKGHQDGVYSAAFSPDGTRIVTASLDKTARVWNADGTGTPMLIEGHQAHVYSAVFSPDGTRIVTASRDQTVRVWNADRTSTPVRLEGHQAEIYSAAFSPDGTRVVTASLDKIARVWNADGTGAPVLLKGHQKGVYSAAFSPDGTRVATASLDNITRVWNTDDIGAPVLLKGHQNGVYSVAFSPDSTRVVTASWDKTVRVWNADGTSTPLLLEGHEDAVYSAAFSPDGNRIVTASSDNTARVWNADGTGTPVLLEGHQATVYSAAFSPDGNRIVTASNDNTARVWNADGTGTPVLLEGHQDLVSSAAFSPDGTRIVTISNDKTLRVWHADGTGEPVVLSIPNVDAYGAEFSPDGTRIVTSSHQKHDPTTGETRYWATIWPTALDRIIGLDDPILWTATSYCPPIRLRQELLGVSAAMAAEQLQDCRGRVAAAQATRPRP